MERSRQWAIRCVHEASDHEENSFITLTYSPEKIPKDHSLQKKDFQDFMKRLRFHLDDKENGKKVRFYACGEYGENLLRPHYHALLFGYDFPDKKKWKIVNNETYYQSEILEEIWGLGHTMIGQVTFESAAYVARYITKKQTGPNSETHYSHIDKKTGEIFQERTPEFALMSRRPGIGKNWYEKYSKDCYPKDFITLRGKKMKIPRYYDSLLEKTDLQTSRKLKAKRKHAGEKHADNNTWDRLAIREEIQLLKYEQLIRGLEKK